MKSNHTLLLQKQQVDNKKLKRISLVKTQKSYNI